MSRNNRIDDGGPAFPLNTPTWHEQINCDGYTGIDFTMGLSIRDYFAAKAMQGLCANPGGPFQASESCGWSLTNCTLDNVAGTAYAMADAMLAARGRQ